MDRKKSEEYPKRRLARQRRLAKIDGLLIKTAVGFLIMLFVSQCFLLSGQTRQFFSMVDRMEGEQISFSTSLYADYKNPPVTGENSTLSLMSKMAGISLSAIRPGQTLIIQVIGASKLPNAVVYVNGKPLADLGAGRAEIVVYEGDYVEIDASKLKEAATFTVNIAENSKIVFPPDGMILKGSTAMLTVGKVRFK